MAALKTPMEPIIVTEAPTSATINGRLVYAGDRVSGAEVVSSGRGNVLLSVRGEARELKRR
jgi:hypothetical protein